MFEVRDGYKVSHCKQYPLNISLVYSNLTARGSRVEGQDFTIFFGLQYFIKKYLIEEFNKFFARPKKEVVAEFKELMDGYLGEGAVDMKECESLHDLGFLPIKIKALPEGTKVPLRVPMLTIVNTLDDFYWLTNALETILSTTMWMPITNATTAWRFKALFDKWAVKTGGSLDFTPFQGHDFSMRGMAGLEAGTLSGAAHLTSFVGSDTVPAIPFLKKYYNAEGLIAATVSATEHSVACLSICSIEDSLKSSGETKDMKEEAEEIFIKDMITNRYPTGIISLVADSYDFWSVISRILPKLRETIMGRDGKVVIRPDSGDPVEMVCGKAIVVSELNGYTYEAHGSDVAIYEGEYYKTDISKTPMVGYEKCIPTSEEKGLIQCLWDIFGGTVNDKGFKELDPHIGAIYGDAITYERATEICERLAAKGFASTNIIFGIGSWTYQGQVTRDTYNMAVKATFGIVNGEDREIYKDPKTDDGTKKSLKGLLKVYRDEKGDIVVKDQASEEEEDEGLLEVVFENGMITKEENLEEIRSIIKES